MNFGRKVLDLLGHHGIRSHDEIRLERDLEALIRELKILEHQREKRLRLGFKLSFGKGRNAIKIQGENMIFTMSPVTAAGAPTTVSVIGSPVTAKFDSNGNPVPSKALLSNASYVSSDPTILTVAADPATPNGAIVTAVANPAPGTTASATLTETATATEPDGTTTEVITGIATIILAAPAVVPDPAAALVLNFGTPSA